MAKASFFVLALLAGFSAAAPWDSWTGKSYSSQRWGESNGLPKCSRECPAVMSSKFSYDPTKTYVYEYTGKSEIILEGAKDSKNELNWKTEVELRWVTPCDMAVYIRNPKIEGETEVPELERILAKYPVIAYIVDGTVQEVCVHPEDETAGINMKKGILSALQNTLPLLVESQSGKIITEVDVAGECPTKYTLERSSSKTVVIKEKDHRLCKKPIHSSESEVTAWLSKLPLPIEKTMSRCEQEIEFGVVRSVRCLDVNYLRPVIGSYKYLRAEQRSELRLLSVNEERQPELVHLSEIRRTNLTLDFESRPTTDKVVPEINELMSKLCTKTEIKIEEDVAPILAELIKLLRRIPEDKSLEVYRKVKDGEYCQDNRGKERIKSIFLDVIAFVGEPSSVKVMVEEILSEELSGGRSLLYATALHLIPRPCIHSIEAVKPLLTKPYKIPSPVILAAATLLNNYCRIHMNCSHDPRVKDVMNTLASEIRSVYPSAHENLLKRNMTLTLLKAAGNLFNMTYVLEDTLLEVLSKESLPVPVRTAAAYSLRKNICKVSITDKLLDVVLHPEEKPEIRIHAYLSMIRCAEPRNISLLVHMLKKEHSTQVRSFIFSHLHNMQKNEMPEHARLRSLLAPYVIPNDYVKDFRKISENLQLSKYIPALELGAEITTNILYTPESFLPTELTSNFKLDILNSRIDAIEVGLRQKNMHHLLKKLIGPESYLKESNLESLIQDVKEHGMNKIYKVIEKIKKLIKGEEVYVDYDENKIVHEIESEDFSEEELETFIRVFGQEIAFYTVQGNLHHNFDRIVSRIFMYLEKMLLKLNSAKLDIARAGHVNLNFKIPTIQGIPLKLKLEVTAVLGLKVDSNINVLSLLSGLRDAESRLEIVPSISMDAEGFAGYDFGVKNGLKLKTLIHSANGLKVRMEKTEGKKVNIVLDIPERMELITMKSEVYMVKEVPGMREKKIIPAGIEDVRFKKEACMNKLRSYLGVEVCYDVDLPNIFHSHALPLGRPAIVKLYARKVEENREWLEISGIVDLERREKEIELSVVIPGTEMPEKFKVGIKYEYEMRKVIVDMRAKALWRESEIARAVRIELRKNVEEGERLYELETFYGTSWEPTEKVFEVRYVQKPDGENKYISLIAKTLGELERRLRFNFEVEARPRFGYREIYWLPVELNVEKLRMNVETYEFKMLELIRRIESSSKTAAYEYELVVRTNEMTLIEVTGKVTVTGSMEYEHVEIVTDTKIESQGYEIEKKVDLKISKSRLEMEMEIIKSRERLMHLHLINRLPTLTPLSLLASMKIHLPKLMRPEYHVEFELQENKPKVYVLNFVIKRDSSLLLGVRGPITMVMERELLHQEVDLEVRSIITPEPLRLTALVVSKAEMEKVKFEVKREEKKLVSLIISLQTEPSYEVILDLFLPSIVDLNLNSKRKEDLIHIATKVKLFPTREYETRLKGSVDMYYREKKIESEFFFTTPEYKKRVVLQSHYDFSLEERLVFLRGEIKTDEEEYNYKLHLQLATTANNEKNVVLLEFKNPSGKSFLLDISGKLVTIEPYNYETEGRLILKTLSENRYSLDSKLNVELLERPLNFKVKGGASFTLPRRPTVELLIETLHVSSPSERQLKYKFEVKLEQKRALIDTRLVMREYDYELTAIIGNEERKVETISKGHVILYREGGVKDLDVIVNIRFPGMRMKEITLKGKKVEENRVEFYFLKNGEKVVFLQYLRPEPLVWELKIESPYRNMRSITKLSSNEASWTVYPNDKEQKYELSSSWGKRSSWGSQRSEVKASFSHPYLKKPMNMEANFVYGKVVIGEIILDIFESPEDKVVIEVNSVMPTENTYIMEAMIKSKGHYSPKVILEASYAVPLKYFNFTYFSERKSEPEVMFVSKYNRRSEKAIDLAVELKFYEKVLYFTNLIKREREPTCLGYSSISTLRLPSRDIHNFASRMCYPMYLEFATKRIHSDTTFIAKMGMKSPDKLYAGLEEIYGEKKDENSWIIEEYWRTVDSLGFYDSWIPRHYLDKNQRNIMEQFIHGEKVIKKPIAMIFLNLWAPMVFSTEAVLEMEKTESVLVELSINLHKIYSEISRFFEDVRENLRLDNLKEKINIPEVVDVIYEVVTEINKIFEELRTEGILPDFSHIFREIKKFIMYYTNIIKHKLHDFFQAIADWFGDQDDYFRKLIMKSDLLIKDALLCLEKIIEKIDDYYRYELKGMYYTICEKLERFPIVKNLMRRLNRIEEEYPREIEVTKAMLHRTYGVAKENATFLLEKLVNVPLVRRNVLTLYEIFVDKYSSHEISRTKEIIKRLLGYYITVAPRKTLMMAVEIPLRRPVSSLPTAFLNIGVPTREWIVPNMPPVYENYRYEGGLSAVLPPYKHVALLTKSTIKTFDGRIIHLVPSECSYKLIDSEATSVIITAPETKTARLLVLTSRARVTIGIFTGVVKANGKVVDTPNANINGIEIDQNQDFKNVTTKTLMLSVEPRFGIVSVMMKPWTFNSVRGLMGTNDNEVKTDMTNTYGKKLSSSEEMMEEWKVDKDCECENCRSIKPVKRDIVSSELCEKRISMMASISDCGRVVPIVPFRKMCEKEDTCLVERSYSHQCNLKGIHVRPIGC